MKFIIFCFALLIFSFPAHSALEAYQYPLEDGYTVEVSFKTQDAEPHFFWGLFGGDWTTKGTVITPVVAEADRLVLAKLLETELSKYPKEFLAQNLGRVTLVQTFVIDYPFGGTWFDHTVVLTSAYELTAFHHEFFSLVLNNQGGIYERNWDALNDPDLKYLAVIQNKDVLALNFLVPEEEAWRMGFASAYARTVWTNDMSETARLVMTNPERAARAMEMSPSLKRKALYMIKYLQSVGCTGCGDNVLRLTGN